MSDSEIGTCPCPVPGCGKTLKVAFSKNNLAVARRPGCCQLFARSENSDQRIRAMVTEPIANPKPDPKPEPIDNPKPDPKPEPIADPKPDPKQDPKPEPKNKLRNSWDTYP